MATLKNASGVKLLLKLGDGASPEVFAAPCSINTDRGIQFTANENTFTIIDCADPEAVAWLDSEIESLRVSASGSGMLNTPDVDDFWEWWESGESKNCQLIVDVLAANGGRIFEGGFKLLSFEINGSRGSKMEVSISFASSGPVTKANNS